MAESKGKRWGNRGFPLNQSQAIEIVNSEAEGSSAVSAGNGCISEALWNRKFEPERQPLVPSSLISH
jgi:hypothetical protein